MQNVNPGDALVFFVMIIAVIQDIRTRQVNGTVLIFFLSANFLKIILEDDINKGILLAGAAVGIILVIISVITKQAIGMADALIMLGLGIGEGGLKSLSILMYALLLAAFVSGILILLKRANKKTTLPFVPFMMAGYIFTSLQTVLN